MRGFGWDRPGVAQGATPNHRDAERRMRETVRDADLPDPDEVRYEFDPDEVVLMWNEPKLAVVIDLENDGAGKLELPVPEEPASASE